VKVGDLVEFVYDDRWSGLVKDWGLGLVKEKYDDNTYEVFWPKMMTTRTLGKSALELVNESR
tara:strand:- start:2467 stop:2652 length:186 start_codon:yes stop_codon:yes gene_type:complete